MRNLKDQFGNDVHIGDTIVHVTRTSTSAEIHFGFIYGVELKQNNHYALSVVLMGIDYRNKTKIYRNKLTSNNFVKVEIPADIKLNLMQYLKW